MKVLILCPGGVSQGPFRTLIEQYAVRCRHLGTDLACAAVRRQPLTDDRQKVEALRREGRDLLAAVPQGYRKIALTVTGQAPDSARFARRLGQWRDGAVPGVAFLVGSAAGLAPEAEREVDECWSLSCLTLQHDLAQLLLAEQVYRALTILQGHPYHKD